MARQALTNGFLSCFMHVGLALVLIVYLPVAFLCRLVHRLLVRPFSAGEDLRGKVVLITGASSGIGEELAYQYAQKGACLALVARRKKALERVAEAARERGAPDVLVILADVSDAEESRRAVEETLAHFGKLNHLVANAGVWATGCFDEATNITAFAKMMDVNFWGSVYPTHYALPHLKASKGKLIVSCSGAGTVATPRMSFYNATKAAQLRFYETLRSEFGTEVGVTILTPGYVESEITQGKAIQKDGVLAVNEETRDAQVGIFPVGRVETFCEIALDSIQKGDWYLTWPSLYRPMELIACIAPEVLNCICYQLYNTRNGGRSLAQRIAEATGVRQLYPSTLLSPGIKTE